MEVMKNIIITTLATLKVKAIYIILMILTFLSPIQGILITVGAFVVADTIMGMYSSKKLGVKLESRKLARILYKTFLYQLLIIITYMVDYYLLDEFIMLFFSIHYATTKIIAIILISIEAFSINESFEAYSGKGIYARLVGLIKNAKGIKDKVNKLKDNE